MARDGLILQAIGTDRTGLVEQISGTIYEAGCNLEDSRMSLLGDEFALVVLLVGSTENLARAREKLESLAAEMELTIQVKPTRMGARESSAAPSIPYSLTAVAMDQPGIVHKVTHVLSRNRINLARVDTRLSHAPITGTAVFSVELDALIPADVAIPSLRAELQELAEDENIDIELRPLA